MDLRDASASKKLTRNTDADHMKMHLMLAEKHDICRVLYKWKTLLPLHYGKVSMGGVTFRISNFLTTLEENITFTFYFNDFCLKLPL